MGTYITKDFVVAANQDLKFALNSDNFRASAFIVSDYDAYEGQVYFEPSIINYGQLTLLAGGLTAGSFFHYSTALSWTDAVFENFGVITAVLPGSSWVRLVTAIDRAPEMKNYGTITVGGGDEAEGVYIGSALNFFNGAGAVLEVSANKRAIGFELLNGGSITNDGQMTAHVKGGSSWPDAETASVIFAGGSLSLVNSGLVEATGVRSDQYIEVISLNDGVTFSIINSGTIRGTTAIFELASGNLPSGIESTLDNSGLIDGNIILGHNNHTVTNSGQVIGSIDLGAGNDAYDGRSGAVNGPVHGGSGSDLLIGGAGGEVLFGDGGNDTLDGGGGIDTAVFAGARSGYTISEVSPGVFRIVGRDGTDTLSNVEYARFDDAAVALVTATRSPDAILGTAAGETLRGSSAVDEIYGLGGNDIFNGFDGDDILGGDSGNDVLYGGSGGDTLYGGAGNDVFFVDSAGDAVIEYAGEGIDEVRSTVDYMLGADLENLRLQVDAVIGTGNDLANAIFAGRGPATLSGLGGTDTIYGSQSGDRIEGGTGNDRLYGRGGADTINGGDGDDTINGQAQGDMISGGAGNDQLIGDDGNDTLHGDAGDDRLLGGAHNDVLFGDAGNDNLFGDDGADALEGGAGIDRLTGGAGRDVMTGGSDKDYFTFDDGDFSGTTATMADRVTDFSRAQGDILRLDLVDANANAAGDQAFTFIGTVAFGHHAGELRYHKFAGYTLVSGDTDGDGAADFAIRLDGQHDVVAGDFQL